MAIKISHLNDEIVVDDQISFQAKTKDNFQEFEEIAKANQDHLADWMPWAEEIPNEGSFTHYIEAQKRKLTDETVDWHVYFNGSLAGAVGLMNRDKDNNFLEIGYWLAKDFTGKGIMHRSVAKVVEVAFEHTDTPKIEIACDKANPASAKVALTNDFTLVSSKKKEREARKESGVHQIYELTREQWEDTSLRSG